MKTEETERAFKEWVKEEVKKYEGITPSALALKSHYVKSLDTEGWRFTELRSIAERTKQIFLTEMKKGE